MSRGVGVLMSKYEWGGVESVVAYHERERLCPEGVGVREIAHVHYLWAGLVWRPQEGLPWERTLYLCDRGNGLLIFVTGRSEGGGRVLWHRPTLRFDGGCCE